MTAFSMLAMNVQCVVHSDIDGVSTIDIEIRGSWNTVNFILCIVYYSCLRTFDRRDLTHQLIHGRNVTATTRPTIGLPFPQCGEPCEH